MLCTISNLQTMTHFHKIISALRKVSDDVIFSINRDSLSIRALDPPHTQLPIITFARDCFGDYYYRTQNNQIIMQVVARDAAQGSKRMRFAHSVTLEFDLEHSLFRMEMIDRWNIHQTVELFMSNAEAFNAVSFIESPTLTVTVAIEQLTPLKKSFGQCQTIVASCVNPDSEKPEVSFGTATEEEGKKSSKLTIRKSYLCDINANQPISIALSFADFASTLRIAGVIGTEIEILAGEPGSALVVRLNNGSIDFHCALATLADIDHEEKEVEEMAAVAIEKDEELQASQVVPWTRTITPSTVKESGLFISKRSVGALVVPSSQPVSD
jgi:hypothetical protein